MTRWTYQTLTTCQGVRSPQGFLASAHYGLHLAVNRLRGPKGGGGVLREPINLLCSPPEQRHGQQSTNKLEAAATGGHSCSERPSRSPRCRRREVRRRGQEWNMASASYPSLCIEGKWENVYNCSRITQGQSVCCHFFCLSIAYLHRSKKRFLKASWSVATSEIQKA